MATFMVFNSSKFYAKMGSPQTVSSSVFDTKAKHKMAWGALTACLSQKPAVLERALVD